MIQTKNEARVRALIEKAQQIEIENGGDGILCYYKINGVTFYLSSEGIDSVYPYASIEYAGISVNLNGLISINYPELDYFGINLDNWFRIVELFMDRKIDLTKPHTVHDFENTIAVDAEPVIIEREAEPIFKIKADLFDHLMSSDSITFNK